MGKLTGFIDYKRKIQPKQSVTKRVQHFTEFVLPLASDEVSQQGARCMDCGIPFCHSSCPVHNHIPDWNDKVHNNQWQAAYISLEATNNFPEFTGRICPAPCEAACTLNLTDEPVSIKVIEQSIIDRAWEQGWVKPQIPAQTSTKQVAIIGSGPAGLACGQQLTRAGHQVTIYEKQNRMGGLLRYGIPDFKLDKSVIDRRLTQLQAEGTKFVPNTHIGVDIPAMQLLETFDACVLAGGAEVPRDLQLPGRQLNGIQFAMDFLVQQNKRIAGGERLKGPTISALDKKVIVIGGGDTGSDCIGTAIRQGAKSVTQIEIMVKPPERENKLLTWPNWPYKIYTSSSQQEGCARDWSVTTQSFIGQQGQISGLNCTRVQWHHPAGKSPVLKEQSGKQFTLEADLVLLAMGFIHPVHLGMIHELGLNLGSKGCVLADDVRYQTSIDKVFCAGDMRRGQSLVVWAIREGRACAAAVDKYLTN